MLFIFCKLNFFSFYQNENFFSQDESNFLQRGSKFVHYNGELISFTFSQDLNYFERFDKNFILVFRNVNPHSVTH